MADSLSWVCGLVCFFISQYVPARRRAGEARVCEANILKAFNLKEGSDF